MVTNDEKLLKERLQFLLRDRGIKVSSLADTESERVMIGRQINRSDTIVSYRTIVKFLNQLPDVDANWLVMGEGSMLKADHVAPHIHNVKNEVHDSNAGGSINVGTQTIPYPVQALLDEKDKRIAELEKINNMLQNVVAAMTSGTNKK